MELLQLQAISQSKPIEATDRLNTENGLSTDKPFIEANTIESSLEEIKEKHIIPVFIKDNEPVISQADFISTTLDVVDDVFDGQTILKPNIRLSHPIKGRIPEAKHKPASELLEHEKTLYYERMAFVIEIPTIYSDIGGNRLSLTVGGIKALNLDNLYNRKGADEHFKVFIGFTNKICTNLCVWTDGYCKDMNVKSMEELKGRIRFLFENYNSDYHLFCMKQLNEYYITEQQFATLIGRCRMYPHLPRALQSEIKPILLGDNQISAVVRDYYKENLFLIDDGAINLWRLYNLFTGACKSTYIDSFLDRSINSYLFTEQIMFALKNKTSNWYLH